MNVSMKPRQTMFNGITMRSRLEAGFAQWLSSEGLRWEYEPQAFASGEGQYLPDFLVHEVATLYRSHPLVDLYIEVKPTAEVSDCHELLNGPMRAIFDCLPDQPVMTAVASKKVIDSHGPHLIVGLRNGATRVMRLALQHPQGIGLVVQMESDMGPWYGEWWKADTD